MKKVIIAITLLAIIIVSGCTEAQRNYDYYGIDENTNVPNSSLENITSLRNTSYTPITNDSFCSPCKCDCDCTADRSSAYTSGAVQGAFFAYAYNM